MAFLGYLGATVVIAQDALVCAAAGEPDAAAAAAIVRAREAGLGTGDGWSGDSYRGQSRTIRRRYVN